MSNKYLMRFTPTDKYFFGSENQSPNTDKNKSQNEVIANYFLKSFVIPQQSTMLGVVRHFFLKFVAGSQVYDNEQIVNKEAAAEIIGEKSFCLHEKIFDFKSIHSISAIYLMKGKEIYLPLPFDKWDSQFQAIRQIPNTKQYYLPNYSAKNTYEMHFTNGVNPTKESYIFDTVIQSGNKKDKDGFDEDEDAFYKIEYRNLKKGWSFAIEVETDKDLSSFNQPQYMSIGGENKLFRVEIEHDFSFSPQNILNDAAHPSLYKVVLISDAYLGNKNPYQESLITFTRTKPFRHLKSHVLHTKRYYNRTKSSNDSRDVLEQSKLHELLERGSVFLFDLLDKATKFQTEILGNDYLLKAGFNQSVLIQPKA